MEQIYNFFFGYGFIFELFLSFALFTLSFKHRKNFLLRLLLCIAVMFFFSYLRNTIPKLNAWTESVKYIILYGLCIFSVWFLFDVPIRRALYATIGASLTQHISFKIGDTCRHFLLDPMGVFPVTVLYVSIVLLVNAAGYFVIARRIDKFSEDMQSASALFLSGGVMVVCVFLQQLFEEYGGGISGPMYLVFTGFDLTCCLFALGALYAVNLSAHIRQEYNLMEHVLHLQKGQMETSKEMMDLINIKCHDLKKMITLLGDKKHLTDDEIAEMKRAVSIYDASVKTGNEALDVLLAEKTLLCENKGILFNCVVDGKSLSFMKSSDIYSLFGNAIDNAIEAVEKIEDPTKRCIGINVKESRGMMIAHLENYFTGALNYDEQELVTTKEDKRYHGFGVKSIKLIAARYGGYVSMRAEGEVFNLDILLPIGKPQEGLRSVGAEGPEGAEEDKKGSSGS